MTHTNDLHAKVNVYAYACMHTHTHTCVHTIYTHTYIYTHKPAKLPFRNIFNINYLNWHWKYFCLKNAKKITILIKIDLQLTTQQTGMPIRNNDN